MVSIEAGSILKNHKLRQTNCRVKVLQFFISKDTALSQRDIELALVGFDRVTIYRTLNSFIDHGILHRIPDDSGTARFGICFRTCSPGDHHHQHVHFKCNKCGHVECIDNKKVPSLNIPGYVIQDANFILNGICPDCQKKS